MNVQSAQYLEELIDYAGIFPPAALASIDAAAEYSKLVESKNSWIVGNIAWSADRLGDFASFAFPQLDWSFAVIGRPSTDAESFATARRTDQLEMDHFLSHFPESEVATYEFRVPSLDLVERSVKQFKSLAKSTDFYLELPWDIDIAEAVAIIAGAEIFQVKFRTGGLKKEMYPSSEQLAHAMKQSIDLEVPFKLTAGLHEPIAHVDSTNGANAHGFLNVLSAAALAYHEDATLSTMVEILSISDESRWKYSSKGIQFDQTFLSVELLEEVRGMFTSFGSCSIAEPLAGLSRLQLD